MFKFLHAADLHLDSPLHGLERYEGAPVDEIRGATRRALDNLVQLAIDEQVKFVLIAGDLYDGNWRDHNTGLYFSFARDQAAKRGDRRLCHQRQPRRHQQDDAVPALATKSRRHRDYAVGQKARDRLARAAAGGNSWPWLRVGHRRK